CRSLTRWVNNASSGCGCHRSSQSKGTGFAHPREGRSMKRNEPLLPALIAAMSRPEFYRERPERVELIQTHISCVFLAGEVVYKIRKPVRFAFLDYSTLEQRYHFSQEEVRLNRRLAPSVYLGVFPILYHGDGFVLG